MEVEAKEPIERRVNRETESVEKRNGKGSHEGGGQSGQGRE